jgi:hypothetical protein
LRNIKRKGIRAPELIGLRFLKVKDGGRGGVRQEKKGLEMISCILIRPS